MIVRRTRGREAVELGARPVDIASMEEPHQPVVGAVERAPDQCRDVRRRGSTDAARSARTISTSSSVRRNGGGSAARRNRGLRVAVSTAATSMSPLYQSSDAASPVPPGLGAAGRAMSGRVAGRGVCGPLCGGGSPGYAVAGAPRRTHPSPRRCCRAVDAGAPPRLGKGHPSSAARRSDPPLTELAPLSPRGRGADDPHPSFRKEGAYRRLRQRHRQRGYRQPPRRLVPISPAYRPDRVRPHFFRRRQAE